MATAGPRVGRVVSNTLTLTSDGSTATLDLIRYNDGSIEFASGATAATNVALERVRDDDPRWAKRLFDTLAALV